MITWLYVTISTEIHCIFQRHVWKTRHSVEQVYLGRNHNKSQHRVRKSVSVAEAGKIEKVNLLFTSQPNLHSPTVCVIIWEINPMFTALGTFNILVYCVLYSKTWKLVLISLTHYLTILLFSSVYRWWMSNITVFTSSVYSNYIKTLPVPHKSYFILTIFIKKIEISGNTNYPSWCQK